MKNVKISSLLVLLSFRNIFVSSQAKKLPNYQRSEIILFPPQDYYRTKNMTQL